MFVRIYRISCCFVKGWRYRFSVGKFYCTGEGSCFVGACQLPTYFILFKSLFCWNHFPREIVFDEELKPWQINFAIWTICRWTKAFFYWQNITKNRHTKWKEHLGFIFFHQQNSLRQLIKRIKPIKSINKFSATQKEKV